MNSKRNTLAILLTMVLALSSLCLMGCDPTDPSTWPIGVSDEGPVSTDATATALAAQATPVLTPTPKPTGPPAPTKPPAATAPPAATPVPPTPVPPAPTKVYADYDRGYPLADGINVYVDDTGSAYLTSQSKGQAVSVETPSKGKHGVKTDHDDGNGWYSHFIGAESPLTVYTSGENFVVHLPEYRPEGAPKPTPVPVTAAATVTATATATPTVVTARTAYGPDAIPTIDADGRGALSAGGEVGVYLEQRRDSAGQITQLIVWISTKDPSQKLVINGREVLTADRDPEYDGWYTVASPAEEGTTFTVVHPASGDGLKFMIKNNLLALAPTS